MSESFCEMCEGPIPYTAKLCAECAADEIERQAKRIEGMRIHQNELCSMKDRRIEELDRDCVKLLDQNEGLLNRWISDLPGRHFTDEQINTAVESAEESRDLTYDTALDDGWGWDAINKLGIKRCEKCGGKELLFGGASFPVKKECPVCAKFTGHGWVIEEVEGG